MLVKRSSEREWAPSGIPGIERSLFRNNDAGGRASVIRLGAGSRFPRHRHQGTEEVLVLAGSVRISEQDLLAGDYLFTEAGEEHDVLALTDAILFVSSQKGTPIVE